MKLVAIDIGKHMGFYNGIEPHTEFLGDPPKKYAGTFRHVRMDRFHDFLMVYLLFQAPDVVAYERPFDRGAHDGWKYSGIIEAVATSCGAAVLDPHNSTIKAWAYPGAKKKTKEMMIAKAKELTGLDLDEHSADAVCIWHYVNATMKVG